MFVALGKEFDMWPVSNEFYIFNQIKEMVYLRVTLQSLSSSYYSFSKPFLEGNYNLLDFWLVVAARKHYWYLK